MSKLLNKVFLLFIVCVLVLSNFSSCKTNEKNDYTSVFETETETVTEYTSESETDAKLKIGVVLKEVDRTTIHSSYQRAYLNGSYNKISNYADGKSEKSLPLPIELEWEESHEKEESSFQKYAVRISKNANMTKYDEIITTKKNLEVYNLEIGTPYYWEVYAIYQENEYKSEVGSFTIGGITPRNLYISGLTNVRDLGGYVTTNQKIVKQGLLIRCSKLNANKSYTQLIDSDGKKAFEKLGIKTEIDLRSGDDAYIVSSVLGKKVKYENIPMEWSFSNGLNVLTGNTRGILEVFDILSKEENYPIIFHCSIGTDRTGMIAFLVEAILGVKEEDIYKDYLFSNFGNIGGNRTANAIDTYIAEVNKCEGKNLAEKTKQYLLNIGVTQEKMDAVIRIMLEE